MREISLRRNNGITEQPMRQRIGGAAAYMKALMLAMVLIALWAGLHGS